MSTTELLRQYFEALAQKGSWQSFLADGLRFTSFTSPRKELTGKAAYLESTKRFFSMVVSLEVRELLVQGEKACVLTRYQLQGPTGGRFDSDVAEVFTVRNEKIESFGIYFDTAPYPK